MSASGPANYEYVVARIRHRRAGLFGDDEYRKLLRMGTGEIARFMEDSTYKDAVDSLASRHRGMDLVEYALNEGLAAEFDALLSWSEGRLYDQLAKYLRKFDAWNVKTVFRGLYSHADTDAIRADLVDAGEFDAAFLDELLSADSVETVVDALSGTIFDTYLEPAFADYEDEDSLVPLENAVDRAYYENLNPSQPATAAQDSPEALYAEFLTAEIDFRNARNALRLARSGVSVDPAAYFIEGGTLFEASEMTTLVERQSDLVSRIQDSTYGDELSTALTALEESDSLIGFEHALDRALLSYSDHLSYVYPTSVCPVLAYVLAKEREVDNIRAIARGREAGMSEDEIQAELVML
ncbi:V-type ATP synthase subunit C [Halobacterium salinarum]|uniref:A-type ATP synthase subunit C n=4 Tax=Halobacterium salinarum TaxID=2242 RepID=AATC_HALSA|nr:V-type ATP synthase subunit C [Halobacterium salinarum]B0R757.1 RecName: Full=V-type ATP synthase subunit C; AltName: Full=V-ATPase subunit C [Halobacterium salinarum R1]Q9HNE1.1 RecName: Full=V-type ATP synthase subunit C; AltName: Full=V-ATPase subunit C [Halobacterium salinarum NRC-1]AAG20279.1 H+-transporting ATP synthase subunit C [Halobacterium salinarum NRC-1]MBB6089296.1 V/A-type H+-transporting ATPase subunit C [Halobacterium salinarum]MDL0119196.1 V-type ATP synthase subunit C [Ha